MLSTVILNVYSCPRNPLRRQQVRDDQAHGRARQGQGHRGRERHPRHLGRTYEGYAGRRRREAAQGHHRGRDLHRRGPEARRRRRDRPQPPLQAHAAADDVRRDHAGHRRRAAEDPQPEGLFQVLRRPPLRGDHAADALRPQEGAGAAAHRGRAPARDRQPRRGGAHHSRVQDPRRGEGEPAVEVRLHRAAGERDPGNAPLPARRPRARQARGRARPALGGHRGVRGDPRRSREGLRDHPPGRRRAQGPLLPEGRGQAAHRDRGGRERGVGQGPDPRRAVRHHALQPRLRQARAAHRIPRAAARRQRREGRAGEGGGFHSARVRRRDARRAHVLHQHGAALPQGRLRDPRGAAHELRAAAHQPPQPAGGRAGAGAAADPLVRRRRRRDVRDGRRHRQEDASRRLQERQSQRHPRHLHRRRRPARRSAPRQAGRGRRDDHGGRHRHALLVGRSPPHGTRRRRREGHQAPLRRPRLLARRRGRRQDVARRHRKRLRQAHRVLRLRAQAPRRHGRDGHQGRGPQRARGVRAGRRGRRDDCVHHL